MQSVSVGFTAACSAVGRKPATALEVSWDGTGDITAARGAAGWTNETAYLAAHRGDLKLSAPGDELIPPGSTGKCTIELDNTTQRYSWLRADGPLYADIGGGGGLVQIPVRVWQGYEVAGAPEYVRVFTGVIEAWSEANDQGVVVLTARDMGFRYAQERNSTIVYRNQLTSVWIGILADAAGIDSDERSLDTGIYTIPYAWLDDESLVDEIWQTAQADGGRAYFDQLGLLRFENAVHWAGHSVAWDFTESDYEQDDPLYSPDDLATEIIVEWSPRGEGPQMTLYELDRPRSVAPGKTETFEARLQYPAMDVIAPYNDTEITDYQISGPGGQDLSTNITISLTNIYAQKCNVAIANTHATLPAYVNFLQLRGWPLVGGPTEQSRADAPTPALTFKRTRTVRGNPYLQTQQQGDALAGFLAYRSQVIRPVWRLRGVPGVPQLELGDKVRFVDRRTLGTGVTREGYVTALRWQSDAGGLWQELALLDATGMYQYGSDYFIIGTDQLGAVKRCWW